jgi:FlaA1/EpsC-like NDP-sugar epimerase
MLKYLVSMPRRQKQFLMVMCDSIILPFSFWAAVALRLSTWQPVVPSLHLIFVIIPLIAVPVFIPLGLYRAVIRYADERLMIATVYGMSLTVLFLSLFVVMSGLVGLPRSSFVIFWLLGIIFIGASRWLVRRLVLKVERRQLRVKRQKIAIYGAGKAGIQLAMALSSSPEYQVSAFFDDNPDSQGSEPYGIRVYSPGKAEKIIVDLELQGLILAMPSASRERRRDIIQKFEKFGLVLKTLPGMAELVGGKVRVEDLREVGIEDLLGRDPVPPSEELLAKCIEQRAVLVTGAGGSIGSELCQQIIQRHPSKLILFDSSEFALYKIEKELRQYDTDVNIVAILGDVKNQMQVRNVIRMHRVQTIYHAAAYKHVPIVEWNVISGVENNILGTFAAATAALLEKVETFVLISTDKAVRPTNVMGATKRFAELILQAFAARPDNKSTRFCMVRFGNVLGSSGSVIPLFKEQILRGGPVTVTHKEVTRFFMTITEAAQLVLQAGSMGFGGDVFVLDMGDPVKIVDLAKKMIELSGLTVRDDANREGDVSISITGLRPGEKLYEELLIGANASTTSHPRILRAEETFYQWSVFESAIRDIENACADQNPLMARALLHKWVREYEAAGEIQRPLEIGIDQVVTG